VTWSSVSVSIDSCTYIFRLPKMASFDITLVLFSFSTYSVRCHGRGSRHTNSSTLIWRKATCAQLWIWNFTSKPLKQNRLVNHYWVQTSEDNAPYRPYYQGNPSQGISTSVPVSGNPGQSANSQSCYADFTYVDSRSDFTRNVILHENIHASRVAKSSERLGQNSIQK